MNIFKLFGEIAIENEKANESIDDTTDKAEQSESRITSAFKKIGGIVATAFAVDKIVEFGRTCVENAATVQAQNAQFEATFGSLGDEAQKAFGRVAESTGILSTRLQVEGTKAFSMFKGAGMDANTALVETEKFMSLAADAAAYYDISLEEASERVLGFAKGNFENGDAIGVFTNEAQRNTVAMDKYGKKYSECTEAQKQMMALDMIGHTYEMSGALGQATREADGYENVTGNLKEAWRQFTAVIGEPVLEMLIPIIKNATAKLGEMSGKVKEGIQWMKEHSDAIRNVAAVLGIATGAVLVYKATVAALAIIKTVSGWMKAMTLAQRALNLAMSMNPIGLVIAAIAALVAGFIYLWNTSEGFRNFWIGLWDTITTVATGVWESIKAVALPFWEWIKETASSVIESIKQGWDSFKDKVNSIWTAITEFCSSAWETIKNVVQTGIMLIVEIITFAVELITAPWRFIWENCKGIIIPIWEAIKSTVKTAIESVKNTITTVMNAIKSFITTAWNAIKTVITTVMNAIKSVITTVWEGIKSVVTTVVNAIKSVVTTVWNAIKSVTSSVFNSVKSVVTSVWNAIKGAIETAVNAAKSVVSSVWGAISSKTSSVFNSIKSTATSVWNAIKSAIEKPINAAKDAVKSAIDKMKSFFNFSWSLPPLKLPHISISGKFSINPPSVPHFGIEWYKHGGIMEEPTLFGYNGFTGKAMVGGEAGAEAITPIAVLLDYVRTAVKEENAGMGAKLERLITLLDAYLPQIIAKIGSDIYLDTGELVGAMGDGMDMKLGEIAKMKARGN